MSVDLSDRRKSYRSKLEQKIFRNQKSFRRAIASGVGVTLLLMLLLWGGRFGHREPKNLAPTTSVHGVTPLVMKDGDPYIRALMRTISASEANSPQPYAIIYGGKQVSDLSRHPNTCIPIVTGPNIGNCTTAAGRYQMLNTTWEEKAKLYHPEPPGLMFWKTYSFEPEFQDVVVYAWLSDTEAWGVDISQLLREGKLNQVLRLLSGTWTSLGYGIESNSMTSKLPRIYRQLLQEECKTLGETKCLSKQSVGP